MAERLVERIGVEITGEIERQCHVVERGLRIEALSGPDQSLAYRQFVLERHARLLDEEM
jgi:hypothetical protein